MQVEKSLYFNGRNIKGERNMATSKNGSKYPNTAGDNVKTADVILNRAGFHRGSKSTEDIIKDLGRIEYVDEGAETSRGTYERASRMLQGMNVLEVMDYLSADVTAGSHYKRRACVKHAITMAAAKGDYKEANKLVNAFMNRNTPALKRRKSKQASNQYLKSGWRAVFVSRLAESKSEHKAAALISYLTGARPHEFSPDLGVTVYRDGDVVTITIMGAKVKKGANGKMLTGATKRQLKFKLGNQTDPALRMLVALIPATEFKLEVKFNNKSSIGSQKNRLNELIGRCGEGLTGGTFSPYSLRHLFASSIKTVAGSNSALVSQALGHISLKTKQYYGRARSSSSGGGIIPISVASSHPPWASVTPTAPIAPVAPAATAVAAVVPVVVKPVVARKRGMKM